MGQDQEIPSLMGELSVRRRRLSFACGLSVSWAVFAVGSEQSF